MSGKVFISYKNTENGEITQDAVMAKELYDALTENDVECFFSTDSLRERGASDYRSVIDRELDECCVLIVVTTSADHVDSRWVEYEWSGFQNDLLDGRKDGKLFSYIDGISPGDLPRALRMVQSFRKSECSLEDIVMHIKNAVNEFCPEPEKPEPAQDPETEKPVSEEKKENSDVLTEKPSDALLPSSGIGPEQKTEEKTQTVNKETASHTKNARNEENQTKTDSGRKISTVLKKIFEALALFLICTICSFLLTQYIYDQYWIEDGLLLLLIFGAGSLLPMLFYFRHKRKASNRLESIYKMTYSEAMLWGTLYGDSVDEVSDGHITLGRIPKDFQNIEINGQIYELSLLPVAFEGRPGRGGRSEMICRYADRFGEIYALEGTYTVSEKGDLELTVTGMNGTEVTRIEPEVMVYYLLWRSGKPAIASGKQIMLLSHDTAFGYHWINGLIHDEAVFRLKGKRSDGVPAYQGIDGIDLTIGKEEKTCTVYFEDGGETCSADGSIDADNRVGISWDSVARPYNGKIKLFDETGNVSFCVINNEPYGFTIVIPRSRSDSEVLYYMKPVEEKRFQDQETMSSFPD